jgi:hypothetical protein
VVAALICIAVLVRRVWQLDGTTRDIDLRLIAVAAMAGGAAALSFTTTVAQKKSS